MKRTMGIGVLTGFVAGAWLFSTGPASASVAMVKKAKEAGITSVTNCQSCHVDKLPKKEKGAHNVNARGQWLVDQKAKRQAKEIDVAWLKEYVEAAK